MNDLPEPSVELFLIAAMIVALDEGRPKKPPLLPAMIGVLEALERQRAPDIHPLPRRHVPLFWTRLEDALVWARACRRLAPHWRKTLALKRKR